MSADNNLGNLSQKSIIVLGNTVLKIEDLNQAIRDAFEYYSDMGNVLNDVLHHQGIEIEPTRIVENWESRSWFSEGLQCEMLQPGELWQKGKLRIKVSMNLYLMHPKQIFD